METETHEDLNSNSRTHIQKPGVVVTLVTAWGSRDGQVPGAH